MWYFLSPLDGASVCEAHCEQASTAVREAHCEYNIYKEKSLIVPLYKAIVRPLLEYCIQAWNPYLRKDIDICLKKYRGEQLNSFQH